ncbi:MAG: family 16 glycosylhydrolase [Bacteroidota bacterium]
MKQLLPIFLLTLNVLAVKAQLPEPPKGYHWEKNSEFSDEFNEAQLDNTKWYDRSPYWVHGRPPATFRASAVSVQNGMLQIKNQPLVPKDEKYHIAGGAVASVSKQALFGYYEVRMKASSISMSSTFWLKNKPESPDCPREQQELDIVEAVGMKKRGYDFNNYMKSNSHIFRWDCDGKKTVLSEGGQCEIVPPASEAFHNYACWWVDENTLKFYLDGEHKFTVHPKKPFDRPMYMHLVTETYNWEDPPTTEELTNDAINTTYYDWIRSYKLVKDVSDSEN